MNRERGDNNFATTKSGSGRLIYFLALQFPLMFSVCSINPNQLWNRTRDVMMYYWWPAHEGLPHTHTVHPHGPAAGRNELPVLPQSCDCWQGLWSWSRLCASARRENPWKRDFFSRVVFWFLLSPTIIIPLPLLPPAPHCSLCRFGEGELSFVAVRAENGGEDGDRGEISWRM